MTNHLPLATAIIVGGIAYGTPLLIAGLGELLAERSGVINLGIEGMMLIGAVTGFWTQHLISSEWLALLVAAAAAIAAGSLIALLHAVAVVTLRANQIVSGLAITIFAGSAGFSTYLASVGKLEGLSARHVFPTWNVFGLGGIPGVGPILFNENIIVYLSWVMVIVCWLYLFRTRPGLELRAVGDRPYAADAMGISVRRYRYVHTVIGGSLAGLAGAYYSLALIPSWNDGLTAGAGWIALGLVIFSFWNPILLLVGAYLFGTITDLQFTLQTHGVHLAPEFLASLPYVMTVAVIAVASTLWRARGRLHGPAALGTFYEREEA